jgi:hypothetical protein
MSRFYLQGKRSYSSLGSAGEWCWGILSRFSETDERYRVPFRRGIVSWSGTFSCIFWSMCMNTDHSNILWLFYITPIKAYTWTPSNIRPDNHQNKIIPKHQPGDRNPLFDLVCDLQLQPAIAWHNWQVLQTCV